MPGGGDWSGAPGYICDVCNRWSENVGPRRGFDYANNVCGGCCDLSSDDDGHNEEYHCRSCKRYMYKNPPLSDVDNYCGECVGWCNVCCEQFHPRYIEKYSTTLDPIIRSMIEEFGDETEDRFGENARDGEQRVELCKDCNRAWKKKSSKQKLGQQQQQQSPSRAQTTEFKTTTTRMDEHCQSCKEPLYKNITLLDNYCIECVGACTICDTHFYPEFTTPMNPIVRGMLVETGYSVEDWFGEDVRDGTENYVKLCKNCKSEWKERSTKLNEMQKLPEEKGTKRTVTAATNAAAAATTTTTTTKRTKTIK